MQSAIIALVDPAQVTSSLSEYLADGDSTSWRVWLVTNSAVAHIDLEFDASTFDANEEDYLRQQRAIPTTNVVSMWVRPLSRITEFSVTDLGALRDSGAETRVWFPQTARISFDDGHTVSLPPQVRLHQSADRARADEFITAIRAAVTGARCWRRF